MDYKQATECVEGLKKLNNSIASLITQLNQELNHFDNFLKENRNNIGSNRLKRAGNATDQLLG